MALLAPSPSTTRGDIVLQPAYFTSSAFVGPARADVDRLVREYAEQCARSPPAPFALFRDIWHTHGWTWIHFKVFDTRSRAVFLRVIMRLFLERMQDEETPLSRVAALFGLYTLLRTQPSTSAPTLYCVQQVEVTCDLYESMLMLPDALDGTFLRPYAAHVLSELLEARVFLVLPHSAMHPQSPRALPREVVAEDEGQRKRGRPSRRERQRKARDSLAELDRRCEGEADDELARARYLSAKAALMDAAGRAGRAPGTIAGRADVLGAIK